MSTRRKQYKRDRSAKPVSPTPRDLDLIHTVFRHRFVDSAMLADVVGGNRKRVVERLRRLFDAGYLVRIKYDHNAPRVYGLTDKGARLLRSRCSVEVTDINWHWKNRKRGKEFLAHTLATSRFMIAAEQHFERQPGFASHAGERVRWKVDVKPLLESFPKGLAIEPDGVFAFETRDTRAAYFVEVDMGSMRVNASHLRCTSIRKKMIAYHESWKQKQHVDQFGAKFARTLFVTTSHERIDTMIETAERVMEEQSYPRKKGRCFLFATFEDVARDGIGNVAWRNSRDEELLSLE